MHAFVVVLHVDFFSGKHSGLYALFGKELDQRLVFRKCLVAAEQFKETLLLFLLILRSEQTLGFGQVVGGQFSLNFIQSFNQRLIFFKHLVVSLGHGTRNNQRCTGIVNENGVNLIDNGVVVCALYKIKRTCRHVVA